MSAFLSNGKPTGYGDIVADAWGNQIVSRPVSLFEGKFTYDIDPSRWFMYEDGVQVYAENAIQSADGFGVITANTGSVASARLESRQCPRYQSNRGHRFSTSIIAPNPTAAGTRHWGMGVDTENGCGFRLKSDGNLYAVVVSGGVEDEQLISHSFDVTKGNVYDIQYQWRGVGNYYFYINLQLVHTMEYLGTLETLSMENPALPCNITCTATSTEDVVLKCGCVDISSENGEKNLAETYVAAYAEQVLAITDTPILSLYNPLLIGTKTNTRSLTLSRISFTNSKKAVFKVWGTRDATAFTGATFQTINSGSYTECDSPDIHATAVRATAVDTSKLQLITAVPVESGITREVDNPYMNLIEFTIVRGDYLVITCTSASGYADVVVEFGEAR